MTIQYKAFSVSATSPQIKRVVIIGASGSGKSTLARALGKSLNLPVIHIDPFFFTEGWTQRPREETQFLVRQAAQAEEWVFEGNNFSTFDARAERADLIVALELGRLRRTWRTIWRTLRYYGRTRPDMATGCPERFDWEFLQWVWTYDTHSRPDMEALLASWQEHRPILRLTSVRDMKRFGADPRLVLKKAGVMG